MTYSRDGFSPIDITRLPSTDWTEVRQGSTDFIHPWDLDTPVPKDAVFDGDTLVISESRDKALIEALGNKGAWKIFTKGTPLVVRDKDLPLVARYEDL